MRARMEWQLQEVRAELLPSTANMHVLLPCHEQSIFTGPRAAPAFRLEQAMHVMNMMGG